MHTIGLVFVGLVALLHIYFFVLEAFLWEKPIGLRIFNQTAEKAAISATLAKNQAFYNGFLAAGLIWSLLAQSPEVALKFQYFNLGCVVVAGIVGAMTASKRIFFVQSMPALIGIALLAASA